MLGNRPTIFMTRPDTQKLWPCPTSLCSNPTEHLLIGLSVKLYGYSGCLWIRSNYTFRPKYIIVRSTDDHRRHCINRHRSGRRSELVVLPHDCSQTDNVKNAWKQAELLHVTTAHCTSMYRWPGRSGPTTVPFMQYGFMIAQSIWTCVVTSSHSSDIQYWLLSRK